MNSIASSPSTITRQKAMPESRLPASSAVCAYQPE